MVWPIMSRKDSKWPMLGRYGAEVKASTAELRSAGRTRASAPTWSTAELSLGWADEGVRPYMVNCRAFARPGGRGRPPLHSYFQHNLAVILAVLEQLVGFGGAGQGKDLADLRGEFAFRDPGGKLLPGRLHDLALL